VVPTTTPYLVVGFSMAQALLPVRLCHAASFRSWHSHDIALDKREVSFNTVGFSCATSRAKSRREENAGGVVLKLWSSGSHDNAFLVVGLCSWAFSRGPSDLAASPPHPIRLAFVYTICYRNG
jgi:hypothetical protein